jgi:hypothetical protein
MAVAEDSLDQDVGHDLAAGAVVTGGPSPVGLAGQHRPHRHTVRDRKQCRQLAHHVGRRPQTHASIGLRTAAALHEGHRVERVGQLPGARDDFAVAHPLQLVDRVRCASDPAVHLGPVVPGQAGGLASQKRRPPLGDPPSAQGSEGAGQLVAQHHRQPDMLPTAVR